VVFDLLSLSEIHGILTDVGREIGDPLEIAPDQKELE
jgi:hypothetical protein